MFNFSLFLFFISLSLSLVFLPSLSLIFPLRSIFFYVEKISLLHTRYYSMCFLFYLLPVSILLFLFLSPIIYFFITSHTRFFVVVISSVFVLRREVLYCSFTVYYYYYYYCYIIGWIIFLILEGRKKDKCNFTCESIYIRTTNIDQTKRERKKEIQRELFYSRHTLVKLC